MPIPARPETVVGDEDGHIAFANRGVFSQKEPEMTSEKAKDLQCRVCGATEDIIPRSYCEECFGPLEVKYDLDELKSRLSRDVLSKRSPGVFRYRELLRREVGETLGEGESVEDELQVLLQALSA